MDAVEEFDHGDDEYLAWIARYPTGYVVNTERTPRPSYLQLHVARCNQISSPRAPGAYTEREYIKFCSTSRQALERWAEEKVGGRLGTGCYCLS